MTVREYLKDINATQYHIFDSHQEAMAERGVVHADQDFIAYSYNIHKNNKPQVGDIFLYRRPGKSSKTRKFYIYGGGVIKSISIPDLNGDVLAIIKKPFKLVEDLTQTDSKWLEDFVWKSKKKEPGSWSHFWNQYGMNVISEEDFYGLVGDLECIVPENHNYLPSDPVEAVEEYDKLSSDTEKDVKGFSVNITDDGKHTSGNGGTSRRINGTHIDYNAVQHSKDTIGKAGELLVVELLREQYAGTEIKVEHTAAEKGDGFGYDVNVVYPDGKETHIEVKTTKAGFVDGFYITPKELSAAKQCESVSTPEKSYQIYRVYNFDPDKKTADIKIYDGPINDDSFRFVSTAYKVYEK